MSLFSSSRDFFALDIGTTAIRAVQVKGGGNSRSLLKYGSAQLPAKVSESDSPQHQALIQETIKNLVKSTGIDTKNVVVGVSSNKTFISVVDMAKVPEKDLDKSIKYQADQFIPTPLEESKIDWAVMGDSPKDANKTEILLVSVTKSFAESRLDMLENAGLNVIAVEPDAIALARSLTPQDTKDAIMILDMGANSTDLVVVYEGNPKLVRSIPVGGNALLKAAEQSLGVDEKQAMQFIYKFGLMQDKLEGQVFRAIQSTVDSLMSEVEKSTKFFMARYNEVPISKIIVTGRASVLPEFPVYLVNKTNVPVEIGNSWQHVTYGKGEHNNLMAVSNQYAVAVGLAERDI